MTGEMLHEIYDKLFGKMVEQKKEILNSLSNVNIEKSNLKETFATAMNISRKLATGLASRVVGVKERLQKLLFPLGIRYDFENQALQTIETNDIFQEIPRLNSVSEDDKQKQDGIKAILCCYVGRTGRGSNFLIEDLMKIK